MPLLLLAAIASTTPARAAQPVWDPSERAYLVERAAYSAIALARLVDTVIAAQEIQTAVGGGPPPAVADDLVAAPAVTPPVAADSGFALGGLTLAALADRQAAGQSRYRQALNDGLALSLQVSATTVDGAGETRSLLNRSQAAGDGRADVQANTRVALAVWRVLARLEAMLTVITQIQAAGHLADDRVTNQGDGP